MPYALGFLGVALLLVGLAGLALWQERQRQQERAVGATQNLARLLEAHVAGALTQADVLLQAAALQVREGGDPAAALRTLAATAPELTGLRLADESGRWRLRLGREAMPGGTATEREEFQRARADVQSGLIVTGPLRHAAVAPWVLVLSRPVAAADGRFAGIVSVDLPVTRFDALFSAIDLGSDGTAAVRTDAMALVYRRPWPRQGLAAVGSTDAAPPLREAVAANPLAGDYVGPDPADGVARIHAYRRVSDHPLYLVVGVPEADLAGGGWNAVDATILALALATVCAAAVTTLALHRAGRRELGATQRHLAAIVESSQDAIASETLDGVITSWNPGAEMMFGYSAAEMVGQSLQRLVPEDRREELGDLVARVRRGEHVAHIETERLRSDGRRIAVSISVSPLLDADGRVIGVSRIVRDITRQKAMEEEVRQLAFHDPLTRLPNRRLLLDRLHRAQQTSRRMGTHAAVLFLDLDRFKDLNDRLGHEAGDQFLVIVAQRLGATVRETDTVARLGGDEFVVVCENLGADARDAAERVAALEAKISEAVAQPVVLGGGWVVCEVSIGHRLFLGTDDEPDRLIADADQSMYRHKQQRRPPLPAVAADGFDEDDEY